MGSCRGVFTPKKTRKWDAEKEEIDDHAEKQAIEALNTLEALEALKAI